MWKIYSFKQRAVTRLFLEIEDVEYWARDYKRWSGISGLDSPSHWLVATTPQLPHGPKS